MKYKRPLKKSGRNKTTKPKGDLDSSSVIGSVERHASADLKVFDELGVASKHVEESYQAACLACWLCKFVLPKTTSTLFVFHGVLLEQEATLS
ncbi:hypothetical protein PS1_038104 [Malus domestica]